MLAAAKYIKSGLLSKRYNYFNVEYPLLNNFHFHSSAIISSNNTDQVSRLMNSAQEDISKFQMIKYNNKNVFESDNLEIIKPIDNSSYQESFPWFPDSDGKFIDFNKNIDVFNGVKMITEFLEKKYNLEKEVISDVKISQMLEPFKNSENVTILELFNHFGELYNKNKESLVKDITSESAQTEDLNNADMETLTTLKPFGQFGETTLNEIGEGLAKLHWDVIINSTKVTLHAAPLAMNLISYTIMLKGYMKYVHNRPFQNNLNEFELHKQQLFRRRNLAIFSIVGAPLLLVFLKNSASGFKNVADISLISGGENTSNSPNVINNSGAFLLLLNKINNKIPGWVKLSLKLLFISLTVLKLLGYSIITDVINDTFFLKNLVYVYAFLIISYLLFNLYLIHLFSTRKVKIPEVLPDFIINWLKDFEGLTSSKASIQESKKTVYIEISLYLIIIIILAIFT